MAPILSLYSMPCQTARHNSQALSMDPSRLHVTGYDSPASLPANSVKYINVTNKCKDMQTEENGGEYVDTKIWEILEINRKTDLRGRIHAGENYHEKEIKVFVSDVDQEPEKCKSYLLLPKSIFTEVRKTRIKDQIGDPLKVQKNGDIWTTQKDKFVKIFVRK